MRTMYGKYFSNDEVGHLKASDIRSLTETERAVTGVMIVGILLSMVFFITLVALILWFNKLTIFLSIIIGVPTLLVCFLFVKGVKAYDKKVKNIKARISQEKHTI